MKTRLTFALASVLSLTLAHNAYAANPVYFSARSAPDQSAAPNKSGSSNVPTALQGYAINCTESAPDSKGLVNWSNKFRVQQRDINAPATLKFEAAFEDGSFKGKPMEGYCPLGGWLNLIYAAQTGNSATPTTTALFTSSYYFSPNGVSQSLMYVRSYKPTGGTPLWSKRFFSPDSSGFQVDGYGLDNVIGNDAMDELFVVQSKDNDDGSRTYRYSYFNPLNGAVLNGVKEFTVAKP